MVRRLVRRFGSWLVLWADHGAKLHVCMNTRRNMRNGVNYFGDLSQTDLSIDPCGLPTVAMIQLNPGDYCPHCGEH